MGELENHARLFNLIAPIYNRFFRAQVKSCRAILDKYGEFLNISPGLRVLDIGCGTGAFANHRYIKYTTVGTTWKYIYFTCRNYGGANSGTVI
jgi:ubiquinone/menaquinone biosynthesis C-methylase UbiE